MNTRWKIVAPAAVLAAGALVAVLIVSVKPKVERRASAPPPPLVRVVEAEYSALSLTVSSRGTVRPLTETAVSSQVTGVVEWTAPELAAGGFLARGQVLARIDDRDYKLAVQQAEARLSQARVRLDFELAETELARRDWEELGEGEPSSLTLREPQLAEARAGLAGAEAALEQARLALERTVIRAPFDARVRDKLVDRGQFVAPGARLASIYGTEAAEVTLSIPKNELAFLELDLGYRGAEGEGPAVVLTARLGADDESWSARIVRIGSEIDPRTRMLPLYARVEDPFGRRGDRARPLPMGLFVHAEIAGRRFDKVVSLPRSALRDGDRVLVVDAEDRLRYRPVTVLRREAETALLSSGVEPGERICVSPLETVVDGMKVRTVAAGDRGEESGPA